MSCAAMTGSVSGCTYEGRGYGCGCGYSYGYTYDYGHAYSYACAYAYIMHRHMHMTMTMRKSTLAKPDNTVDRHTQSAYSSGAVPSA